MSTAHAGDTAGHVAAETAATPPVLGTAMVYPALIASVADHTHLSWRAQGLGDYRFGRNRSGATGPSKGGSS